LSTEYAVELLFKESEKKIDLQKFIITAIYAKNLHDSAVKIFELMQKVISMHSTFVKPFSKNLVEICIQCLKYSEPSARFKEMAVKTISEIIEKEVLEEDDIVENTITGLMNVLKQEVKSRCKFF
jgi:hypothetical protein